MTYTGFARTLSVIGHPALLMPVAVVLAVSANRAPQHVLLIAASATILVAIAVFIYVFAQVRAGRWEHVDASVPSERRQLNLFLALLLFGAAGMLWANSQPPSVAMGLATGGALVAFAQLLRSRLKVSLHAAFAVYAAALFWPNWPIVVAGVALAAGIAWSRLVLRRHTLPEVATGLLAGGVAGFGFILSGA